MQQLRFYCSERLQFGTGDKASNAQRDRLGHSRINACGDGAGSSVDEARGSPLLEGEYVTSNILRENWKVVKMSRCDNKRINHSPFDSCFFSMIVKFACVKGNL